MPGSRDHFFSQNYAADYSTGPFRFLNPTNRYHNAHKPVAAIPHNRKDATRPSELGLRVAYVWRSRDNRKGRHALAVNSDPRQHAAVTGPRLSTTWGSTFRGIWKMFVRYPVWDVSYDVAVVFTIGSIIWVINGFFAWLPMAAPSTEFPGETDWGTGLTALIGATVFEFGSVLLVLEAVNENRAACFGWAVEESLNGVLHLHQNHECQHSHAQKGTWVRGATTSQRNSVGETGGFPRNDRTWFWWPSWYELRTHYFHEVGFLACVSQMIGASIFWIAGITSLAPIQNSLSNPAEEGVYWLPQVIGGTGFIISSSLFMLEVQPRWYIPAPSVLGWHVGLWNLIGGIGFTLCGALGFAQSKPGVDYALTLSTFIGSWAFLIGSTIQWFESLDKYPIWVDEKVGASELAEA